MTKDVLRLGTVPLLMAAIVASIFGFTGSARAATITWDGGGTDVLCGGAGTEHNWSCPENWSGDVVPGVADIAVFNGTSVKNAVIDVAIDVLSIDVNAGYTGVISQAMGATIDVGTSSFDLAAGTFVGDADSAMIVNDLIRSGGSFTAPGTITLTGSAPTVNSPTALTVQSLVVDPAAGSLTIMSNGTVIVAGDLSFDSCMLGGTLRVHGDVVQNVGCNTTSTTALHLESASAQTYTMNGGRGPVLMLDSSDDASDSIVLAAPASLHSLVATTSFDGTIPFSNPNDYLLTVYAWTQSAGTFDGSAFTNVHIDDLVLGAAATFNAPETLTMMFSAPSMNVHESQTVNNLVIDPLVGSMTIAAGDTIVVEGTLTFDSCINGGTLAARGNVVQNVGCNTTSTASIVLDGAAAQTYTMNGGRGPVLTLDSADDASDSIVLAANAALHGLTVNGDFAGTVPFSNPNDYDLTIFNLTQSAGTFDADAAFSALSIGHMTLTGGTFVAPELTIAVSMSPTWNVNVSQEFNDVNINLLAGNFYVASNDTVVVTGDLTLTNGAHKSGVTATLEARRDVTVLPTWDGGNGALTFSGNARQEFNLTGAVDKYDGDIIVNKSGNRVELLSALDMNATWQDLIIEDGVFNLNGHDLSVDGLYGTFTVKSGADIWLQGGETTTFNVGQPVLETGSEVIFRGDDDDAADAYVVTDFATTYGNLTITSQDGALDTFELGANVTVNDQFRINDGTFDVTTGNYTMNVGANWHNYDVFVAHEGSVVLTGGNQRLFGGTTFHNFTKVVSDSATLRFPSSDLTTFTGELTLAGASGDLETVRSESAGVQASIDAQGASSLEYLRVRDINNVNATTLVCDTGCVDLGNNTNWTF